MAFPPEALSADALLGGRVRLHQPRGGYRAATDPVLLAASLPARAGESVLELGCGAGAALLCLAARVPGLALTGLELQPDYAALAQANAAANGVTLEVIAGDLADPPPALRGRAFDHVIANPPWFAPDTPAARDPGRATALREGTPLASWIDAGLRRLRPGGWLTVIHRSERLPDMLAATQGRAGATVLPLAGRAGRSAERVIVQFRKGGKAPFALLAPLVLHAGPAHLADRDDFSAEASAILRDAAPLSALQATRPPQAPATRPSAAAALAPDGSA